MQQFGSTQFGTPMKTFGTLLLLLALLPNTTARSQALMSTLSESNETRELRETNKSHSALFNPAKLTPALDPQAIIRNFIATETRFRETLLQFSFQREVVLQTIGPRGEVTGEYLRRSGFVLDDRGKRIERVLYHPASTIKQLKITKEDVQDLAGSQLFGLEPSEIDAYNFSYVGRENLNQRAVHLIAVTPKQVPDPQHMRARFFVGRIWIDADSFQILKLQGTTEPHGKQRFPLFETERGAKIEDQFFPSSTSADQVLRFPHVDIHYRIAVRYYDFKRFAGRLKIVELDE